jgi:hypothetical protein
MALGLMTLSIMTLSIMALSIMTLSIKYNCKNRIYNLKVCK